MQIRPNREQEYEDFIHQVMKCGNLLSDYDAGDLLHIHRAVKMSMICAPASSH